MNASPTELARPPHEAPAMADRTAARQAARKRPVRAADRVRGEIAEELNAGPRRRLVAAAGLLAAAHGELESDRAQALLLIASARRTIEAGLEELQRLARGIHPKLLSDRGLDTALDGLAASCPTRVSVHGAIGGRLPEVIELAAYYVVEAGLRRAVDGGAASIDIDVSRRPRDLRVAVYQDGTSPPSVLHDRDLGELSDRVGAIGGRLMAGPASGRRTLLAARIPLRAMGEAFVPSMPASSRTGLLEVADRTRQTIERDLHDGAQQRFLWLALTLQLAERLVARGEAQRGAAVLREAMDGLEAGLQELAELVGGIQPATLRNEGLAAALDEIAARAAIPVALNLTLNRGVDQPVELAAYFLVSEAIANVIKHSDARHAGVVAAVRRNYLQVVVADDGRGGADPRAGAGLRGLADRVGALGGTFFVDSPAGVGTILTALLPADRRR
jgi:signal transduction histidine kinase